MKRTFLTLAILASISLTSFASTEISLQKDKKGDFPKELQLSKEQKKQFKEINEDFAKQIKAVKMSRITEEMQDMKIKKLNEDKREAVNKILTAEQQAQFAKKQPRGGSIKKEPKRGGREHKQHGKRHDMFADLDLTDVQKEKMKELREQYNERKETNDQTHKDAINEILTPEQQAKLKEKRASFQDSRKNRKKDMERFNKLSADGKEKYKTLKEAYQKQRSAVEMSRIAPEMQKIKLDILKENFDKDVEALISSDK